LKFWKLKNLFFSPRCMICGDYLTPDSTLLLCSFCFTHLPLIPPEHCPVCGRMTPSGGATCFQCQTQKPKFRQHRSVVFYTSEIRYVLLKYKFYRKRHYAATIGTLMSSYVTENYDFITAVPVSEKKKRNRGYNQSRLLAEQIEQIRQIPYKETLQKTKHTPPQSKLGYKQRLTNIKNCFSVINPDEIRQKRILLIDDIYTTGSTIGECSKVLKKAGAAYVDVLTFAMTDKRIKSIKGTKNNE